MTYEQELEAFGKNQQEMAERLGLTLEELKRQQEEAWDTLINGIH